MDVFQNSSTFLGYSKFQNKIQGPFKDFMDRHEIQGFQGFFQRCGNLVINIGILPTGGGSRGVSAAEPGRLPLLVYGRTT